MGQTASERAIFFFFLTLFSISLFLAGTLVAPFFATIVLALVVAGIIAPLYRLLASRLKPTLASILTCVSLFFVVFVPVLFFVGVLSKEAYGLYLMGKDAVLSNQLQQLLESTHALEKLNTLLANMGLDVTLSWDQFIKPVSELGTVVGFSLFQQASFIASNVFKIVFYFCLMLIVVFYLLIDGKKLVEYIYDLSPLPNEHNEKLAVKFKDIAGAVLMGNGLGGLIQGVAGGVVFFMLDFNSPFLWGVIMGFLAFLPIAGIGVVLVPTSLILILKSKAAVGLAVLVFYVVLSWGVEYIFKPKMVGDRVKMHPLVVFFAIIGGLKLYGILGIIYGPLIVTLFLTLADIYFDNFQVLIEPNRVRNMNNKEVE